MVVYTFTYESLYERLKSQPNGIGAPRNESSENLLSYIVEKLPKTSKGDDYLDDKFKEDLRRRLDTFSAHLLDRWRKCDRSRTKFETKYAEWLRLELEILEPPEIPVIPRKDWSDLSDKSKRRKIQDTLKDVPTDVVLYGAKARLYDAGKRAAADLVSAATEHSPSRPVRIRKLANKYLIDPKADCPVPYTPEEALELYLRLDLNKGSYKEMRLGAKCRKADIYPTYEKLKEAKENCYPEGITVTAKGAIIPLQSLLDHTTTRILAVIEIPEGITDCEMEFKWGGDGSSGHTEYMQIPEDADEQSGCADGSMFLMSVVPLCLSASGKEGNKIDLWRNPSPSSTRFCRPLRILFEKESQEQVQTRVQQVKEEIVQLNKLEAVTDIDVNVNVKYTLFLTMLDGKSVANLSRTSTQTCYVCGSKPSEMNKLDVVSSKPIREENLDYGLTILHLWIRFLECVLHIAYKLGLQAATTHGATAEERAEIDTRKKNIQEKLFDKLGIRVDKIVQGKGTSNTGNVGRKFFKNFKIAAECTGVDERLIRRFGVILTVLSSGRQINISAFQAYAMDTARLYVKKYGWYFMPVAVHKVLIHGSEVIRRFLLPIGIMSEEALEASNKIYRRMRERHTRKISKEATTTDLVHGMLVRSDPQISMMVRREDRNSDPLPKEASDLMETVEEASDSEESS